MQDNNQDNRYYLKRQPLEVFNTAYMICDKVRKIKHPEELANKISDEIRHTFLAYETSIILSCVYVILSFTSKENQNMMYFLIRIRQRIQDNYFTVFEPLLKDELTFFPNLPNDFEFIKSEADKIENLDKRELYYTDFLTRYKQAKNKGNITQQITDEIDFIKRQKDLSNKKVIADDPKTIETVDSASIKVKAVAITEMLKQIHLGTANNDLTKICRLISFLTGNSYNSIYNEMQKGIEFTKFHKKQIEEINKIFSELNASISIDINKQY